MRALTFLALVGSLAGAPAAAQQLTAAQQEVWRFEQACWETTDLEPQMACFHDDFRGWGIDNTVPTTKADRRPFFERDLEQTPTIFLALQPVSIDVRGNTAIALYLATLTTRNVATGEENTRVERWTDISIRENGRWSWIADHGVLLSED